MAESLNRADEAVRLLRQAPLETLLAHWIGSVPMALGLLVFRSQITRPHASAAAVAASALLLAFLLLWMNCWRSVFAGKLRRQLGAAADPPWTRQRLLRLITAQAWFGATKLYLLPLSALIVFTAADTIAFYRLAAVLAGRGDLDLWQLRARARQIVASGRGENWRILPVLLFLQVVTAINLALLLAALPQLFRILTGIETAFSRGAMVFIQNPLFPFLVLALTWLALDPFVQAVYVVRCFRIESVETGEDVRAGLERIRAASAVAAALFLIAIPARAAESAAVQPPQLQRAIEQAEQSHEYDWRLPRESAVPSRKSWIVDATDRALAGLRRGFSRLMRTVARWIQRVLGGLRGTPDAGTGAAPAGALHWSILLLIAVLTAAALWMVWQKRRQRPKPGTLEPGPAPAIPLDQEDLTPDRLPEDQWLQLAAQCVDEQKFRLALRAYYLANLAWLGRAEYIRIHAGKTNREYQAEVRRKTRSVPEMRELFGANIAAFERAWYGLHEVGSQEVEQFQARAGRMKAVSA